MSESKFESDVLRLTRRLAEGESPRARAKLAQVRSDLIKLYRARLVKINHSALELVVAKKLILQGYGVKVEQRVSESLVCDVYGAKEGTDILVEIETGYVPPAHALDPESYCNARIASKTARYSQFASKFVLGTPMSNLINIPELYLKPTSARNVEEAHRLKTLCDKYYTSPPITIDQIMSAHLHAVYILDVDATTIYEMSPEKYHKEVSELKFKY